MKTLKVLSLSILALAVLALAASAQQPAMNTNQQTMAMHCMQGMGMQGPKADMMKNNPAGTIRLGQSAAQLRKNIANARQASCREGGVAKPRPPPRRQP